MTRIAIGAALAIALGTTAALAGGSSAFTLPPYAAIQNPLVEGETWGILKDDVVGDVALLDGEDVLSFTAPETAFDPAVVPFSIEQKDSGLRFNRLIVVVDENPAPIAADFQIGPAMAEIHMESRVRYDVFSNIRAIAFAEDGRAFMVGRFVQAAGGCSAAVSKDLAAALKGIGAMKLKEFAGLIDPNAKSSGAIREAQVMIRHPNFTGMQVHTGTLKAIDPRYVEMVEVKLGDELIFRMTGGFSLSENPNFRFKYRDNGAAEITVRAVDTDGVEWVERFPVADGA